MKFIRLDAPRPNETIVLQIPLNMFEGYFTEEQFIWFTMSPEKKMNDLWN